MVEMSVEVKGYKVEGEDTHLQTKDSADQWMHENLLAPTNGGNGGMACHLSANSAYPPSIMSLVNG